MVEYSNQPATETEISSSYTEEGYKEAFGDPMESADRVVTSGVTPATMDKLKSDNDKAPATSRALIKKKLLKKLFLQYIRKYVTNPKKYVDHPKQIRNLPSWFDDAIVLFSDAEISREQKRNLRDFFYGLIQYRDMKVASGEFGPNTDEANRQLGERSPYALSEENPELTTFPKQQEVGKLNFMDIAKSVAAQKTEYQPTMEDYIESTPEAPLNVQYIETPKDTSFIKKPESIYQVSLEGLIGGGRKPSTVNQPKPVMTQSTNQMKPSLAQPARMSPVQVPTRGGFDLTKLIMGGKESPSIFPVRQTTQSMQPVIPATQISQGQNVMQQYRRKNAKVTKPKISRKKKNMGQLSKGIIPKGITLNSVLGKSAKSIKNASKKATPSTKVSSGLSVIRNMDSVFGQIKKQSKNNFGGKNLKMPIVSDIKRQCDHAFNTNSFKVESTKIKNNYFDDVKNAYPKMRMEMEMLGDIHEKRMLGKSVMGVPHIIKMDNSAPYIVKRGSMRPESIGITSYDFDLGNVYKKKKKIVPIDEDVFYDES